MLFFILFGFVIDSKLWIFLLPSQWPSSVDCVSAREKKKKKDLNCDCFSVNNVIRVQIRMNEWIRVIIRHLLFYSYRILVNFVDFVFVLIQTRKDIQLNRINTGKYIFRWSKHTYCSSIKCCGRKFRITSVPSVERAHAVHPSIIQVWLCTIAVHSSIDHRQSEPQKLHIFLHLTSGLFFLVWVSEWLCVRVCVGDKRTGCTARTYIVQLLATVL